MKRMWIVGVAALALAIIAAVVIQEPSEAIADPVEQEAVPEMPDAADVLPADYAQMEAAAQLDREDLYQDLAVTEEEFAAQVAAFSVAMETTTQEYAEKVYPGEDTELPAWAAEMMNE